MPTAESESWPLIGGYGAQNAPVRRSSSRVKRSDRFRVSAGSLLGTENDKELLVAGRQERRTSPRVLPGPRPPSRERSLTRRQHRCNYWKPTIVIPHGTGRQPQGDLHTQRSDYVPHVAEPWRSPFHSHLYVICMYKMVEEADGSWRQLLNNSSINDLGATGGEQRTYRHHHQS